MRSFSQYGKMYEKEARAARARRRASLRRDQQAVLTVVPSNTKNKNKRATPTSHSKVIIPSPIRTLRLPEKESEGKVVDRGIINWDAISDIFGSCVSSANLSGVEGISSPAKRSRSCRGVNMFSCASTTPSRSAGKNDAGDIFDLIATPDKAKA